MNDPQPISNHAQMTDLCHTFPTLRNADGVFPWDPEKLDAWACGPASHGGTFAARFILAVWHGRMGRVGKPRKTPKKDEWHGQYRFNLDTHWRCGPFDVVNAMGTWDSTHRAAFLAWAENPWWP